MIYLYVLKELMNRNYNNNNNDQCIFYISQIYMNRKNHNSIIYIYIYDFYIFMIYIYIK